MAEKLEEGTGEDDVSFLRTVSSLQNLKFNI